MYLLLHHNRNYIITAFLSTIIATFDYLVQAATSLILRFISAFVINKYSLG